MNLAGRTFNAETESGRWLMKLLAVLAALLLLALLHLAHLTDDRTEWRQWSQSPLLLLAAPLAATPALTGLSGGTAG